MLAKGVNVALGVDCEGINDDDDTFQEMRLAMMLHRQAGHGLKTPDEWDVLMMATINGARAVLLEDRIGTLEPGKEADIVLIKLDRLMESYLHPSVSPVAALVYLGRPQDVDVVMVAGEVIFRDDQFTRFDGAEARSTLNSIMETVDRPAEREADAMRATLMPYVKAYYAGWPIPKLDSIYVSNSRQ